MPETRWIDNFIDDVTLIYMRIEKSVMITTTEPDSSRTDHCQRQALIVVLYGRTKEKAQEKGKGWHTTIIRMYNRTGTTSRKLYS